MMRLMFAAVATAVAALDSPVGERAPAVPVVRCSCVVRADLREQVRTLLKDAYAIFSGEVIATNRGTVTFKRDKVWKGDLPPEFTAASGPWFEPDGTMTVSSCDHTFKLGVKYLVFAQASTIAAVQGMACTPTGELTNAKNVVALLDELAPPR